MDLKQRKLSKAEWDSIEIPVSKTEQEILTLITAGYSNVNIKINKTDSLFTFLKIEYTPQIEEFLYSKYFADKIKKLVEEYSISFIRFCPDPENKPKHRGSVAAPSSEQVCYINVATIVKLKSTDQARLSRLDSISNTGSIYEHILCDHLEKMVTYKGNNNNMWMYQYYTLNRLLQNNIEKLNKFVKKICKAFIDNYEKDINLLFILQNSVDYIERNENLLKYSDLYLYDHQKEIFTVTKDIEPKLILYIAPTGTGKTLSPLGLSESHKVIFVCAARHVGLALARSAISIHKRIAFAFGCSSAEDVRLHYFAAKEYTTNKRTGQIKKVDNTIGDKVEIIICDIRSYLPAMYYMLAFNKSTDIITYWDEPTITLDYEEHELHKVIKKNWKENVIPNFVLSSATLPKMVELSHTINDFMEKFPNGKVCNIVSHDCRKTIPLIDNNGYVVMPHYISDNYPKVLQVVEHCEQNLTLLRYFDLNEASKFIFYIETNNYCNSRSRFSRNFACVDDVDMKNIKLHYLRVLKGIIPSSWSAIYSYMMLQRTKKITFNNTVDCKGNKITRTTSVGSSSNSLAGKQLTRLSSEQMPNSTTVEPTGAAGVYVTTKDAYTLTDGPTIFLANDLEKIAKFCIQQSNIPASVMKDITTKIEFNNQINEKIEEIESALELEEEKMASKLGGSSNDNSKEARGLKSKKDGKNKAKIANNLVNKTEDARIQRMREEVGTLKGMIKRASLDDLFVPNKLVHLKKWADNIHSGKSFTSDIDDDTIVAIMSLKDVDDSWKVLLLLGIGVFTEHKSSAYTEIMKKLADTQKLYLIIADSDYIYGTNYQFCHGYLSKDLVLTQEKIIQALGRIGRNNIQQEYSARFRDDSQIAMLFTKFAYEDKPEVINMNQLFNSKNIKWNGTNYELVNDELTEEESINEDEDENDDEDDEDLDEED